MRWNPDKQKEKILPSINKLIQHLKNQGLHVDLEDGENVSISSPSKTIKISHHSFYRYSSIACVYKEKDNVLEIIDVTDEMYVNNFLYPIIEKLLKK